MAKTRIVLNRAGVRALLRSQAMMEVCEKHARDAQARLGEGYVVTTRRGKNRVNASVAAQSFAARRENARSNTILKALK